jgi:hypothetical protein
MDVAEQAWMESHHRPDWQKRLAAAKRRRIGGKNMAINKDLKIEVGDEFEDADWRAEGRLVKIIAIHNVDGEPRDVLVETARPANSSLSKRVGQHSKISVDRLRNSRFYRKVSR